MTLAPWRPALDRALHRNRARVYCRYLQLATINIHGKPSNRTVVFRGFVGEALQMVTDGRSEKVQQVQAAPWAEACWYFTVTREQFRIAGKLTLLNGDNDGESIRAKAWQALNDGESIRLKAWQALNDGKSIRLKAWQALNESESIRAKAWQALSDKARQQFYWPPPGQIRDRETAVSTSVDSTEQPPDSFNVLLLTPDRVDHLALHGQPQDRCIYEYTTDAWTVQEVNP